MASSEEKWDKQHSIYFGDCLVDGLDKYSFICIKCERI